MNICRYESYKIFDPKNTVYQKLELVQQYAAKTCLRVNIRGKITLCGCMGNSDSRGVYTITDRYGSKYLLLF